MEARPSSPVLETSTTTLSKFPKVASHDKANTSTNDQMQLNLPLPVTHDRSSTATGEPAKTEPSLQDNCQAKHGGHMRNWKLKLRSSPVGHCSRVASLPMLKVCKRNKQVSVNQHYEATDGRPQLAAVTREIIRLCPLLMFWLLLNHAPVSAQSVPHPTTNIQPMQMPQHHKLVSAQNNGLEQQQQLNNKLEAPIASQQHFFQGPGLDLVAFNRRRFELEHQHSSSSSENELRVGELIESKVAAIPDRILNRLPDDVNKQILETLASDASLISGDSSISPSTSSAILDDPDGASIERLTKSCLTVHASSARPEQLNVTFHLYTKNNPRIPYILGPQVTRFELIKSSPFDPNRPIKWITHGFHTNVDKSSWMVEAKDKILAFEDANVILTDWRRGASPALAFYPKAAANAHIVAKMIVKILRRLRQDVDFRQIHLIGHSLGAHVAGFVGSAFTEEYLHQQQQLLMLKSTEKSSFWRQSLAGENQLIGRITACDPALPCFGPTSGAVNSQKPYQQTQVLIPVTGSTVTTTTTTSTTTVGQLQDFNSGSTGSNDQVSDWTPTMWTHLRPDSAVVVEVMHSNAGVMGYLDPLGKYSIAKNVTLVNMV